MACPSLFSQLITDDKFDSKEILNKKGKAFFGVYRRGRTEATELHVIYKDYGGKKPERPDKADFRRW